MEKKERIRRYRRYVYEAGSVNRLEKGNTKVIEDKVLEKERRRAFELSKSGRFRYRTRYFTDSGIIGSKEFVEASSDCDSSDNLSCPHLGGTKCTACRLDGYA